MTAPLLGQLGGSITAVRFTHCFPRGLAGSLLLLVAFSPALKAQARDVRQLDSALRARYQTDQDAPLFAGVLIAGLKGDIPLCAMEKETHRRCNESRSRESIRIRDGQVQKSGLLGKLVGTGDQAFAVGDTVQVTSVLPGIGSTIIVEVRSTRAVIRNNIDFAFEGSIQFQFDKNRLKESPIEEIFATIDAVLQPLPGMTFRDAVHLGDRLGAVRAVLGRPTQGSKTWGDKTVDKYKNLQVTFVDGRVVEIQ